MSVAYTKTSPYYGTGTWGKFLDIWNSKTIDADPSDAIYQIDSLYNLRPDLLAYDLYQDSNLWWVFVLRNPDVLKDPLLDFLTGTIIYVPQKSSVTRQLGI
jgi:hypothetical protein